MASAIDENSGADQVLAVERDHLASSREFLRLMREDVLSLPAMAGDRVSEEYLKADLYRRAESLRDLPDAPLFFGRLDYAAGAPAPSIGPGDRDETDEAWHLSADGFHIGRRHVHDPAGHPVVIDWRAPVSRPFYRASQGDPMDLARRRRFGFSGGQLTAFEDEIFTAAGAGPPAASPASTASPARTASTASSAGWSSRRSSGPGPARCATSSRRSSPTRTTSCGPSAVDSVCVQGAPGTGKTAVGLHRVAYLLYAHRERMSRGGMLVLGPNRAFLAYIRNVLPALGEFDAEQTSVTELISAVPVRGADSEQAARLKGDARMAEVLRRALWERVGERAEPILLTRGSRRWRVPAERLEELVDELRERGVRYGTGREMLSHRIAHVILSQLEAAGETCDDRTHEAVRRTSPVRSAVNAIWPKADPVRVVFSLLSDPALLGRAADGLLSPAEQAALSWPKPPRSPGLGALVGGRRRADRRGQGPARAHAEPGPHRRGRSAGPVRDGLPGDRAPVHDRVGHRAR